MSETALSPEHEQLKYELTMWNDKDALEQAWKTANFLSESDLVPQSLYKKKPGNCLIALDVANRTGMSPLMIMQNMYVVQGRPTWSGQMCIALINGCGRFSPLSFRWGGKTGQKDWSCVAVATRLSDGVLCESSPVTWQMALDEGWVNKNGSKWKTMPEQMFMYRSGAFFARVHCPDVLQGIYTREEMEDVYGQEKQERKKTVITLDDTQVKVVDDKESAE
jgi:hypothetical protein